MRFLAGQGLTAGLRPGALLRADGIPKTLFRDPKRVRSLVAQELTLTHPDPIVRAYLECLDRWREDEASLPDSVRRTWLEPLDGADLVRRAHAWDAAGRPGPVLNIDGFVEAEKRWQELANSLRPGRSGPIPPESHVRAYVLLKGLIHHYLDGRFPGYDRANEYRLPVHRPSGGYVYLSNKAGQRLSLSADPAAAAAGFVEVMVDADGAFLTESLPFAALVRAVADAVAVYRASLGDTVEINPAPAAERAAEAVALELMPFEALTEGSLYRTVEAAGPGRALYRKIGHAQSATVGWFDAEGRFRLLEDGFPTNIRSGEHLREPVVSVNEADLKFGGG